MTHERAHDDEPPGGPALDDRLPDAIEIPVTEGPGPADEDVRSDESPPRRAAAGGPGPGA